MPILDRVLSLLEIRDALLIPIERLVLRRQIAVSEVGPARARAVNRVVRLLHREVLLEVEANQEALIASLVLSTCVPADPRVAPAALPGAGLEESNRGALVVAPLVEVAVVPTVARASVDEL